jgi:hypothetical protein
MKTNDLLTYGLIGFGVYYFLMKPKTPGTAIPTANLGAGTPSHAAAFTNAPTSMANNATTAIQNIINAFKGTPANTGQQLSVSDPTQESIQNLGSSDQTIQSLGLPTTLAIPSFAAMSDSGYMS